MQLYSSKPAEVTARSIQLGKQNNWQCALQGSDYQPVLLQDEQLDWRDHQITTRNEGRTNPSSAIISVLWNMMQDELINGDNTLSVLDSVDENLLELVSSDSDDKIGDSNVYLYKPYCITVDSHSCILQGTLFYLLHTEMTP
jgi:hypothetical protein